MAGPTKEELAGELAERIRTLESKIDQATGAISLAKWFFGASALGSIAAVLTAFGGFVWTFLEVRTGVAVLTEKSTQQTAELGRIEKLLGGEIGRVEKSQATEAARNDKAMEKLEARLTRQVSLTTSKTDTIYHEHVGKISRITSESVTLSDTADGVKYDATYVIAPGARVLDKGAPIKLEALRPGMYVRVLHRTGSPIQLIETAEDELPKPALFPPPAPPK